MAKEAVLAAISDELEAALYDVDEATSDEELEEEMCETEPEEVHNTRRSGRSPISDEGLAVKELLTELVGDAIFDEEAMLDAGTDDAEEARYEDERVVESTEDDIE